MTKTALYRHFDKDGRLLYVGISSSPFHRARQHGLNSHWFGEVVRIDIEWCETRSAAEQAEYQAIKREHPLHNRAFKAKASAPGEPFLVLNELAEVVSGEQTFMRPAIRKRGRTPLTKEEMAAIRQANVEARRLTSSFRTHR